MTLNQFRTVMSINILVSSLFGRCCRRWHSHKFAHPVSFPVAAPFTQAFTLQGFSMNDEGIVG